jgi:cytochrome b subunit of formate dehydrogenase
MNFSHLNVLLNCNRIFIYSENTYLYPHDIIFISTYFKIIVSDSKVVDSTNYNKGLSGILFPFTRLFLVVGTLLLVYMIITNSCILEIVIYVPYSL